MSRRRPDIQVFSISFLDVLSCALGGIILLWLLSMQMSQEAAAAHATEAKRLREAADRVVSDLERAKHEGHLLTEAKERLEQAQNALIGWEFGANKHVVFVFDTSGSMGGDRFEYYKTVLIRWVNNFPFRKFNVIEFNTAVIPCTPALVDATSANRSQAERFISKFVADGGTATKEALEKAFGMEGVDTIVLLSDGMPNGGPEHIKDFVRTHKPAGVFINTVAMGAHEGEHRQFLAEVAALGGGSFQGL